MGNATATLVYGPLTFSMDLPAKRTTGVSEPLFSVSNLKRLESAAANWIIDNGVPLPETIRLLRSVAGLTATELSNLLGVDRSQVSRWENGKYDPGIGVWTTVAMLAIDKMKRKAPMSTMLAAVRSYKANPIVGEIRLPV